MLPMNTDFSPSPMLFFFAEHPTFTIIAVIAWHLWMAVCAGVAVMLLWRIYEETPRDKTRRGRGVSAAQLYEMRRDESAAADTHRAATEQQTEERYRPR